MCLLVPLKASLIPQAPKGISSMLKSTVVGEADLSLTKIKYTLRILLLSSKYTTNDIQKVYFNYTLSKLEPPDIGTLKSIL